MGRKKCVWPNALTEDMIICVQHKKPKSENIGAQMMDMVLCFQQQVRIYINNIQRIIKYKLEQQMSKNMQSSNCFLCSENVKQYTSLISHSLYGKYSSTQNFYYGKQVDEILDEAISPAYIQFQDNNYYDDSQEYLKRQYKHQQYPKKIEMLSQYYKFHRDLPTWNDRGVEPIMAKYYGRLKDVDYKKIKSVLKKQQGISLTTHKSFSSFQDSEYTKKSRYSTMLNDLEHSNDSLVLRDVCQKIGKALKKVKIQNNFKGSYYSGQKKFQEFLKKQKKRKQNNFKKQEQNKKQKQNAFGFKKIKFNPKLNTKNDEVTGLKDIIYGSNHSIKQRKYATIKNTISNEKTNEKTGGNQTISRQQKSKREKSKSIHPSSSRTSFSKKPATSRDNFVHDAIQSKFKSVKTFNIANIIHNNQNLRTINQIYKPVQKLQKKQKTSVELSRKSSSKQLISRLKFRSNSHHNLPTASILNRDLSKKQLMSSLKSNRSASKKSIPISVAKGSIIELDGINHISQKSLQSARQNSHRILRTNSSGKLNNQPSSFDKQYTTSKIPIENKGFGKKRNSIVENILEKKLTVFKRKQAVM